MDIINFVQSSSPWIVDSNFRYPDIIDRSDYDNRIDLSNPLVQIVLGARRVGKTSILRSLINRLVAHNEQVFYLSADNPLLNYDLLYETLEYIASLAPAKPRTSPGLTFVFIDEIQDIDDWQKIIKYFYDTRAIKFVLSGSSSLIISRETARLTGRHQIIDVWPLSYSEAQQFKSDYSLEDYLIKGSYPEIVTGRLDRSDIVSLVESTLYRDLVSLYGIRNPEILVDLVKLLAAAVGTPISTDNIRVRLGIDPKTAKKLLDYLITIKLIFQMPLYTNSAKRKLRNPSKYYFIDSGIVSTYSLQQKPGLLAENAVAVNLVRTISGPLTKFGFSIVNGQEIDFRFGNALYEVKYRDDWQDFTSLYENLEIDNRNKLQLIIPAQTTYQHPLLDSISLGDFLQS